MASRYWVGGSGNWNSSNTANWSTSSGGASGASVPTASDTVFVDGNSYTGVGSWTITVVGSVTCLSCFLLDLYCNIAGSSTPQLTITGPTATMQLGSFAPAVVVSPSLTCNFTSTSTPFSGNFTVSNVIWLDNLTTSGSITASSNFYFNRATAITITCSRFTGSSLSQIATLNASNNSITITGTSGTIWDTSASTGLYIANTTVFSVSATGFPTSGVRYINCPALTSSPVAISFFMGSSGSGTSLELRGSPSDPTIPFVCNTFNANGLSSTIYVKSYEMKSYGSVSISTNSSLYFDTVGGTNTWTIYNNNNPTITTNADLGYINVKVDGAAGSSVTFAGTTFSCLAKTFTFSAGTIYAAGVNFYFNDVQITTTAGAIFYLNTSTWYTSIWNLTTPANVAIIASTSTIVLRNATTSTFTGGGKTYYRLRFGSLGGTTTITDANSYQEIKYSNEGGSSLASTLILPAGLTTTSQLFTVSGNNNGARVTVQSSILGTNASITNGSTPNQIANYANLYSITCINSGLVFYRTSATSIDAYTTGFTLLNDTGTFFLF